MGKNTLLSIEHKLMGSIRRVLREVRKILTFAYVVISQLSAPCGGVPDRMSFFHDSQEGRDGEL